MKKVFVFILALICASFAVSVNAYADWGPKPSVTVYVNGVEDGREYYVALIEKQVKFVSYDDEYKKTDDDVRRKIYEFAQTDGYYLANRPVDDPYHKLNGKDSARWGYMPPEEFKILLYFPDNESFLVSDVQEKYAFASYFNVEVNGDSLAVSSNGGAKGIAAEAVGLVIRIVITVLIEIGVAVSLGYRGKPELRFILITNIITQVLLNVFIAYGDNILGGFGALVAYIFGEIGVFIVEAIVYSAVLPSLTEPKTKRAKAVGYAFIANAASFFGGGVLMIIADLLLR